MTSDEITVKIDADGVPVEATGATPEEAAAAAVEAYRQLTEEDENDTSHLPDLPDLPNTDPVEISPPRRTRPDPSPPTDPFGPYWGVDRKRPWQVDDSGDGDIHLSIDTEPIRRQLLNITQNPLL